MPGCYDCGRPYGDENGFPDLIVPNDIWVRISPTGDYGGLLCPSCICKRLYAAGIKECEASFMSGPIHSIDRVTMANLLNLERIERWMRKLLEPKE